MSSVALQVKNLCKSFGKNDVLRGIDLTLETGRTTVLMGANGAGKSTLVKVICGHHAHDGGTLALDGANYAPSDPAQAISLGVVTVHQSIDDGVIPELDVASNLMLDHLVDARSGFFVRQKKIVAGARKVADAMGIDVDLNARVADLAVADRQMIAIARAMAKSPRILILDEPTSSLSATEATRLFDLLDRLKEAGVAILYISHRMSDIRRVADRILCMRDGEISGTFEEAPLDYEGAVTAMLGHKMDGLGIDVSAGSTPVLDVTDLQLWPDSAPINLSARDGEVVAIIGLLGSGKTRLAEVIYGMARPVSGTLSIDGTPYAAKTVRDAVQAGVFMSPKDRGTNAVVPAFNIANNMTLPFLQSFSAGAFLKTGQQREKTRAMNTEIGIVCQSELDEITTLSGGNQQKVMIARWLLEPCRVLLLDEPFQGVDIGARRDIGRHIRASASGRATLVFMAEIDEAIEIADRIIVMNEGAVVGEHINNNIDLNALVSDISGTARPAELVPA